MIIIRPIKREDQNIFVEFSFESVLGMTNLPRDRERLFEKIVFSETSFNKPVTSPNNEEYFFVLEDLTTGRIGGTCAIRARNNRTQQFYYQIESIPTSAKHLSAPADVKVLKVISQKDHSSEVCSLYLQPSFRHSGQGRLLSLSRFLFIAAFRKRFEKRISAELRGFIDERQISPFWEAVGKHFCNLSFVELMTQLDQDRIFISEILPKYPIYIDLLPLEVQQVIGKTHENTKPALAMLLNENFSYEQNVDVFDAGPVLSTPTSSIRTIKNSSLIQVHLTSDLLIDETEFILSNEKIDFRACFGKLQILSKTQALVNKQVADALQIKNGDVVRYVAIH